jgi:hypothetical protein
MLYIVSIWAPLQQNKIVFLFLFYNKIHFFGFTCSHNSARKLDPVDMGWDFDQIWEIFNHVMYETEFVSKSIAALPYLDEKKVANAS